LSFPYIPSKTVEVPEISFKDKSSLPPRKTALLIVDMQNDFVNEKGSLVVEAAGETVPRIQKLLNAAREAGLHIAFTQDTQVENDPEWDIWPKHCKQGTWGWEIIDELNPHDNELICLKNRYDAFYGSWLGHFLATIWDVDHVVIVGTVSNICVLHTAASAGLRWYHIVVPADCISAMTEFDQALTLRQTSSLYAGDVLRSVDDLSFAS
jgi:nicotinamidase-related amidase